ncbi:hypothetical protein EYF80_021783 [Liparis tanakae]|uniref:Uncharacterized protein n=1 Tax=Liparis tanakae TaxID=230148 RepID=A0A4Z2HQY9_9TELE|nr:hypothetical protein EYF80_021783 [Liparis tanakae]
MDIIRLTCNIDINRRESGKRHRGHILRSDPKGEDGRGLVVQRLGHQNGRRAVLAVGREVETNRHIGFGDRAILQVIGHPRITQLRSRLDALKPAHGIAGTEMERGKRKRKERHGYMKHNSYVGYDT